MRHIYDPNVKSYWIFDLYNIILSDVISGRFLLLKKQRTEDFGLNFQINRKFWDLHLQNARYEQYKVPYFTIFKLKISKK